MNEPTPPAQAPEVAPENYTLPPITDFESSPDFKSLPLEDQSRAIDGYYMVAERQAKDEADHNRILQERAQRAQEAWALNYRAKNPDITEYDPAKEDDETKSLKANAMKYLGDLHYNTESKTEAYKADDIDDPNRALRFKPFKFQGVNGYSVIYPNGETELVKGVDGRSQLTEFLKQKRLDKFNGKNSGLFGDWYKDSEFDQIYGKITNTETGMAGGVGELRKTWSSMFQGKHIFDVSRIKKAVGLWNENMSTVAQLEPIIERERRRVNEFGADKYRLTELENQLTEAKAIASRKNSNLLDSRILADLNPLADGYAMSPAEAAPYLTDKYKEVIDEMQASAKIKGSSSAQLFRDHIANLSESQKTEFKTVKDYFKQNPAEIIPYGLSIATASIPDLAAILGASTTAAAATGGSPIAAGVAAQAVGYFREYSGTLLSEVQLKAAEKNLDLAEPGVIDQIMSDPKFMASVEEKASIRAGVISGADAILGAGVAKIADSVKSAFKRAILGGSLGAFTEGAGEAGASLATEGKVDWAAAFNESLGAGPVAAGTVVAGAVSDRMDLKKQIDLERDGITGKKEAIQVSIQGELNRRVDDIGSQIGLKPGGLSPNLPKVTVTPLSPSAEAPGIARPGLAAPSAYDQQLAENRLLKIENEWRAKQPADDSQLTETADPKVQLTEQQDKEKKYLEKQLARINEEIAASNQILADPEGDYKTRRRVESDIYNQVEKAKKLQADIDAYNTPLPAVKSTKTESAFEGEAEAPFAGKPQEALKGPEQKALAGQAIKKPFNGEVETPLTQSSNKQAQSVNSDKELSASGNITKATEPSPAGIKSTIYGDPLFIPQEDDVLGSYIDRALTSKELNEADRAILEHLQKNASPDIFKDVLVMQGSSTHYNPNVSTIFINPDDLMPSNLPLNARLSYVPVHEIIHGVTTDFFGKNIVGLIRHLNLHGDSLLRSPSEVLDLYYRITDSKNRNSLISEGIVTADYIHAVDLYLSYLASLGITKNDVGSDKAQYFGAVTNAGKQAARKKLVQYGSLNLDEFFAEALSNLEFQKILSALPSLNSKAKNLFTEIIQAIAKILNIPSGKENLLFDVIDSAQNIISNKDNTVVYRKQGTIGNYNNLSSELSSVIDQPSSEALEPEIGDFSHTIPVPPPDSPKAVIKQYENTRDYEKAKGKLTIPQLTDLSSKVGRKFSTSLKESYPRFYQAVDQGIAMFNRFADPQSWQDAMQQIFQNPPKGFIPSLWNAISDTFAVTVDRMYGLNSNKTAPEFETGTTAAAEHNVRKVFAYNYLKDEVSEETINTAALANTQAARDAVVMKARLESFEKRFSKLKAQHPQLLSDMTFNGVNLPEARERVLDSLFEQINKAGNAALQNMAAGLVRKTARQDLIENRLLAILGLRDLVNIPLLTESQAELMVDAMEYMMRRTAQIDSLETPVIQFYANILASFSDGGPPIGFKYIVSKALTQKYADRAKALNSTLKAKNPNSRLFFGPIANWYRKPWFGRVPELGSMVQQATEVNAMAATEESKKFLTDLMGTFKYNIDAFQLEHEIERVAFNDAVVKAFPKGMDVLQRTRVGLVARLSQWKLGPDALPPVKQMIDRLYEVTESIGPEGAMTRHDKAQAKTTTIALDQILKGKDFTNLGDENAIVQYLESQLTDKEKEVLKAVRDVGQRYLPVLQTVKSATRNAILDQYQNYVHDASTTVTEPGENNVLKDINSMSDVLQQRVGIDPHIAYPELDIVATGFHQIKASVYEKHTGMERYALSKALEEKSPLTKILNKDTDGVRTVSGRLLELARAYHNAMTKPQDTPGYIGALVDTTLQGLLGTFIVGINAFTKNFNAATVSRSGLASLSMEAMATSFLYNPWDLQVTGIVKDFLKTWSPTQFNRFSSYDTLEVQKPRWDTKSRYQQARINGDSVSMGILKAFPYMPLHIVQFFTKTIIGTAGRYSNSLPEKHHAFGMWLGAYTHYLKQAGLINSPTEFLVQPVYDKAAMFQANEFVNRSLGYSPDKASKGSYWHSDTATKHIHSRLFHTFRQQGTGMAMEFQRNIIKGVQQWNIGQRNEAMNSFKMAATGMSNYMVFKASGMVLASSMLWGGMDRHINTQDDEEEIAAINEAKRKNAHAIQQANTKDYYFGLSEMFLPIAANGGMAQFAGSLYMQASGLVMEPPKNMMGLLGDIEITRKKDLNDEIKIVDDRIKFLERAIALAEDREEDTKQEEDELDKMEVIRAQLTEERDFDYVPSTAAKTASMLMGAYGMGAEEIDSIIRSFIDTDLDPIKQEKLKNIMEQDFTYNRDQMAGYGYANDVINNLGDLTRAVTTGDWGNKQGKPPGILAIQSAFKAGQNPLPIIQRAVKALAEIEYRHREKVMKRAIELQEVTGYGPSGKPANPDSYEGWNFPPRK